MDGIQFANFEISKINFVIESGCGLFASACSQSGLRARMSLLRYLKKGSGSVLPSPGGPLSRHMPSSSIASANKEVKSVLECRSHKPRSQTSSLLSVDRKCEVSKLNVGVVLIIAIREFINHENEFDVNSRNIRPSKIIRYTVCTLKGHGICTQICSLQLKEVMEFVHVLH